MTEKIITNKQKVHFKISPVDSDGQPEEVDGKISVEVQDGTATFEIDEDGKGATLISGDDIGTSTIKVSADADLGSGVETIEEIVSLVVIHPKATSLGLAFDEPVAK